MIPKCPISERDLAEFYILDALSPVIENTNSKYHHLLAYRNQLIIRLAKYYVAQLQFACVHEALHNDCYTYPFGASQELNRNKLASIGIVYNTKIDEDYLWARSNDKTPSIVNLSLYRIACIFRYFNWERSYGGQAWAHIAELANELYMILDANRASCFDGYTYESGYDIYTYGALNTIRNNMSGKINQLFHRMTDIIDSIHQLEHNSGSIFNKFAHHDVDKMVGSILNKKAVASSIQVLRPLCSDKIIEALNELHIIDQPIEIVECQLGEVVLNRSYAREKNYWHYEYNYELALFDLDLETNYISLDECEKGKKQAKEALQDKLNAPIPFVIYNDVVNNNTNSNEIYYGVYREIVKRSKTDDRLYTLWDITHTICHKIYKDLKLFNIFKENEGWHNWLVFWLSPFYDKLPVEYKKEMTDFLYAKFNNLTPNRYFFQGDINRLYDQLLLDKYDMTPYKSKKIGQSNESAFKVQQYHQWIRGLTICSCGLCIQDKNTIHITDAISFAHKYSGQAIKKIKGKASSNEVAGFVIGYKYSKAYSKDPVVVWLPTKEFNKKHPTYKPVKYKYDIQLTAKYDTKMGDIHYSNFDCLEVEPSYNTKLDQLDCSYRLHFINEYKVIQEPITKIDFNVSGNETATSIIPLSTTKSIEYDGTKCMVCNCIHPMTYYGEKDDVCVCIDYFPHKWKSKGEKRNHKSSVKAVVETAVEAKLAPAGTDSWLFGSNTNKKMPQSNT